MPLVLNTGRAVEQTPKVIPSWVLKALNARYFIESTSYPYDPDWGVSTPMVDQLADLLASNSQSVLDSTRTITDYLMRKMKDRAANAASQSINVLNAESRDRATTISPGLDAQSLRDRIANIARSDAMDVVANSVQASTYLNSKPWMREYGISQAEVAGLTPRFASALNNRVLSWQDQGLSAADIRKDIVSYAESSRLSRAESIIRTELSRAENDAFQAQMEYASNNELSNYNVMRVWITARDERTCPQCAPLDNKVVELRDSLENPITFENVQYPPLHPNCRCYIAVTIAKPEPGTKPLPRPTPGKPPLVGVPPGKTWEDQAAYAATLDPSIRVSVSTAVNMPDHYYVGHDGLMYKVNELDKYGIKADTLFSGRPVTNVRVLPDKSLLIQMSENATADQINSIRRMINTSKSPFQLFVWNVEGKPSPLITTLEAFLKQFKKEPTEREHFIAAQEKEKAAKEKAAKEKKEKETKEEKEKTKEEKEKEEKERNEPEPTEPTEPSGPREVIYQQQNWEMDVREAIKLNPDAIVNENDILVRSARNSYVMDSSGQWYDLDSLSEGSGIKYPSVRPDGVNSSIVVNVSSMRVNVHMSVNITPEQMKALESLIGGLNRRTIASVIDANGSTTDYNSLAEAKLHIALSNAPLPIRKVPTLPITTPEPPRLPEPPITTPIVPAPSTNPIPWERDIENANITPHMPNERFIPVGGETYIMTSDGTMYRMSEVYRVGNPSSLPGDSSTSGYIEITYNTAADRITFSMPNTISRAQFDHLTRAIGNIPASNVYWQVFEPGNTTAVYRGTNENQALNYLTTVGKADLSTVQRLPLPTPTPSPTLTPIARTPENWQAAYMDEWGRHPELEMTAQQAVNARDYVVIDNYGTIYNDSIALRLGLPSGTDVLPHRGVLASITENNINFAVSHDITPSQISAIGDIITRAELGASPNRPINVEISVREPSGNFSTATIATMRQLETYLSNLQTWTSVTSPMVTRPPVTTPTPTQTPDWQQAYASISRHPNLEQTIGQSLDARGYSVIDRTGQLYNADVASSIGLPAGVEIIQNQGVHASIGSNWINFSVSHNITEAQIHTVSEMINSMTARGRAPQVEISIRNASGQWNPVVATSITELRAELQGVSIPKVQGVPISALGGIHTIEKARDVWEGDFGNLHSKVTGFNIETYGGDTTIEIYGNVVDPQGYSAGSWHRTLYPERGEVHHSLLTLKDSYQGNNFATEFNNQAFAEYKAAGYTYVTVFANIDVGGYTWAKQGFDFASPTMITRFIDKLEAYRQSNEYTTRFNNAQRDQYEEELKKLEEREKDSTKPKITAFEISQFGKSYMPWIQAASSYGSPNDIQMWPGKSVMLGTNWNGIMQL